MGSENHARLGTQARQRLAEAYRARGHRLSKLAYTYSPRMQCDVVFRSLLEFGHFLLAESDPRIAKIEYAPQKEIARVQDEFLGAIVDAVVELRDGTIEWREIKPSGKLDKRSEHQLEAQSEAAFRAGVQYRRFTEKEIYNCPQRIENWIEVVSWLAAVRDHPCYEYDIAVTELLKQHRLVTVADIQALAVSRAEGSCFVAAAFRGVQAGKFFSDLDFSPLSPRSVISIYEVDA